MKEQVVVGKRLFCNNRRGKLGCGRTLRLYVATAIPKLTYTAHVVTTFVLALIAGLTIQGAYKKATKASEPRNAYRWITKLTQRTHTHRSLFKTYSNSDYHQQKNHRLNIVLSTLKRLFNKPSHHSCSQFQTHHQISFF